MIKRFYPSWCVPREIRRSLKGFTSPPLFRATWRHWASKGPLFYSWEGEILHLSLLLWRPRVSSWARDDGWLGRPTCSFGSVQAATHGKWSARSDFSISMMRKTSLLCMLFSMVCSCSFKSSTFASSMSQLVLRFFGCTYSPLKSKPSLTKERSWISV